MNHFLHTVVALMAGVIACETVDLILGRVPDPFAETEAFVKRVFAWLFSSLVLGSIFEATLRYLGM